MASESELISREQLEVCQSHADRLTKLEVEQRTSLGGISGSLHEIHEELKVLSVAMAHIESRRGAEEAFHSTNVRDHIQFGDRLDETEARLGLLGNSLVKVESRLDNTESSERSHRQSHLRSIDRIFLLATLMIAAWSAWSSHQAVEYSKQAIVATVEKR